MMHRDWTLVLGAGALVVVGGLTLIGGATLGTAAYRGLLASLMGGLLGFALDVVLAQVPPPELLDQKGAKGPESGTQGE
ncbi:MAG: hypothetical protein FJY99_09875 [Candidatus Sericytochromatia bacterium]|nr:hypothetical protein [Candidatus Tanganyikabacteria bacterium]